MLVLESGKGKELALNRINDILDIKCKWSSYSDDDYCNLIHRQQQQTSSFSFDSQNDINNSYKYCQTSHSMNTHFQQS